MPTGTPVSQGSATGSTATTGSFTVPTGDLIVVASGIFAQGVSAATPSISDSVGLSWQLIGTLRSAGATRTRITVWAAVSTGVAMTVSVTSNDATTLSGRLFVGSVADASTDFTNHAEVSDATSGSPAPSLPTAPAANSLVMAFGAFNANPLTVSPPSGFTELAEIAAAGPSRPLEIAYDVGSPPQTAAWSTAAVESSALIVEMKSRVRVAGFGAAKLSGSAAIGRHRSIAGSGGVRFNGSGSFVAHRTIRASGSVRFIGSGLMAPRTRSIAGSGGVRLSGTARVNRRLRIVGSSTIRSTGAAVAAVKRLVAGAGQVAFGGTARIGRRRALRGTGALSLGGSAVIAKRRDRRTAGMFAAVIQIDGWDPVAGAAVAIRASSVNDERVCHVNGQTWWPVVGKLPVLRYDLFDGGFTGQIGTPASELALAIEPWADFGRYALADARIRIWTGAAGDAFGSYTLRFDGRVTEQPSIKDQIASIPFAVDDRWLDQPLLATYAGTTGIEGDAALKGTVKPLSIGAPRFVPGQMIDTVNNVIQLSAYGSIQDVEVAFERVIRRGASIGDYPSYAALVAATIPAGTWATSKAAGLVRLGAPPVGMISHHVKGDNAGPDGWVQTPGEIIKRIALIAGGSGRFDEGSMDALDSARPWNISIYQAAQTTARQLIQRIAASVNAVAGVDWLGQLFAVPIGFGSPTMTLNARGAALPPVGNVQQLAIGPPYWKLALQAERTWQVHALSDVAFWSTLVDRGDYSATEVYMEGSIVQYGGSSWVYINPTPTSGNAPPTLPTTSNTYWKSFVEQGPVGDTGNKTVTVYKRSATQPSTPTGNGTPSTWSLAPPSGSNPLWMSTSTQTAANVLIGSWSAPVRITGDDGATGATGSTGAPGRDAIPFYQTSTPSSPVVGDTWLNPSTKVWKRWNGSIWEQVQGDLAALSIITTAYIQLANIITAHIADLNVTTLKVADGAVSATTVFSATPVDQITGGSYQDIGSPAAQVSVNTATTAAAANQAVLIVATTLMHRGGSSDDTVACRCLRDGSTQIGREWIVDVTNDRATFTFGFVDMSPPANASPVYKIQARNDVGSPWVDVVYATGQLVKK
jgi:hypothetical protein